MTYSVVTPLNFQDKSIQNICAVRSGAIYLKTMDDGGMRIM